MSSNPPLPGTDTLPNTSEFCTVTATSSVLYDHSYIHRFNIPNLNTRNTKITPQRYAQLQQNISNNIDTNIQTNNNNNNSNLNALTKDITKAFANKDNGYSYPESNPLQTNINSKNKNFAKYKINTINQNINPNKSSLKHALNILSTPRSKLLNNNNNDTNTLTEEKSMDISDDNSRSSTTTNTTNTSNTNSMDNKLTNMNINNDNDGDIIMNINGVSNHNINNNANGTKSTNNNSHSNRIRKKITPLKRKLTEIVPSDDENDKECSPYKTPKANKRRKLTHRRSSLHLSQTPFLQHNSSSMSLSQTQLETPNNNNNNNANTNDIQNIESHFNAFYSRF
eukprot:502930_1